MQPNKLAILAGGGNLPRDIALAAAEQHISTTCITFKDQPQPDLTGLDIPCHTVNLAAVGQVIKLLKHEGVSHVVMAGHVEKPKILALRPDATGAKLLLSAKAKLRDDNLLNMVAQLLEQAGIEIIGAHDIAPHLLMPHQNVSNVDITVDIKTSINAGLEVLAALGALDIGQAVVVQGSEIIGIEGAEGTNGLIQRCASYRPKAKDLILVKGMKHGQSSKLDMPTVGLKTLENLHKHNYLGVAVVAGQALLLDKEACTKYARKHKLLLAGVETWPHSS